MIRNRLRQNLAAVVNPERLLLALKSGLAVGISYVIGSQLPAPVSEYAFYAALGAIVSMLPTVVSSLRESIKTAISLTLGILVAWAMIALGLPALPAIAIAVGFGVILAGIPALGSASQYLPIAAAFVLLLGGAEPGNYSLGYIAQMALGMGIGVTVNLLIVPPLHFNKASARLSTLRTTLADTLDEIADALVESWPPSHSEWSERISGLDSLVRQTEPAVNEASESRKINPRARHHPYNTQEDVDDLHALNTVSRLTSDIGETISGAIWQEPLAVGLPDELLEPLSEALARTADLVRAWNAHEGQEEEATDAERALDSVSERFAQYQRAGGDDGEAFGAVVLALRRMLALIESRLRTRRSP